MAAFVFVFCYDCFFIVFLFVVVVRFVSFPMYSVMYLFCLFMVADVGKIAR